MTRGQPGEEGLDLSNPMLTIVGSEDVITPGGLDIRNYPGSVAGLPEARALFGPVIGVRPEETVVGNNSCLLLLSQTLMWALLRGLQHSPRPWVQDKAKMIVTVPGYDRHFDMLMALGIECVPVPMTPEGPDMEQVERLAAEDSHIKGILFVPVYSNPTGDTVSDEVVRRLAKMETAAPDFTILADNAYAVHHLTDEVIEPKNLLRACEEAGHADRAIIFGSTSKITFAGAGLGFLGTSRANVAYLTKLMGFQSIGPNKVEQYRHVRFLNSYPGGVAGLMQDHGRILRPKFEAVNRVLTAELAGTGLATWTNPKGGYFISLNTTRPVADRVVQLAGEVGVALTPAGATYPGGVDPHNSTIRLAPSRPSVAEVEQAMEVVALCVKLASWETQGNN